MGFFEEHGFRRSRGRIVARLDPTERAILTDLVGQLVELVAPVEDPDADPLAKLVGIDPDAERPDDPALARLFPDAYADDEDAASEFRRFTERSLRDTKVAHARTVLDTLASSGDKVVLSERQAVSWLGTINDLRLTLGSRLGITDDRDWDELPEDHPAALLFSLYDWLTFLQETLVHALTGLSSVPPTT